MDAAYAPSRGTGVDERRHAPARRLARDLLHVDADEACRCLGRLTAEQHPTVEGAQGWGGAGTRILKTSPGGTVGSFDVKSAARGRPSSRTNRVEPPPAPALRLQLVQLSPAGERQPPQLGAVLEAVGPAQVAGDDPDGA